MMATTPNYHLPLPDPQGIQQTEIQRVADALNALDAALKALSQAQAPNSALLAGKDLAYVTDVAARLGYTPLDRAGGAMHGGLSFGSQMAAGAGDLSRHIDLYGGAYGFAVTANTLTINTAGVVNVAGTLKQQGQQVWHEGNFTPATKLDVAAAYTRSMASADIAAAIDALMNGAPAALDTLKELADALGDDPHFANTIAGQIGTKLDKAGGTLTGALKIGSDGGNNGLLVLAHRTTGYSEAIKPSDGNGGYVGAFGWAPDGSAYWRAGNDTDNKMTLAPNGSLAVQGALAVSGGGASFDVGSNDAGPGNASADIAAGSAHVGIGQTDEGYGAIQAYGTGTSFNLHLNPVGGYTYIGGTKSFVVEAGGNVNVLGGHNFNAEGALTRLSGHGNIGTIGDGPTRVRSPDTDAFITYLVDGAYRVQVGLRASGQFGKGGGSLGATFYEFWDDRNGPGNIAGIGVGAIGSYALLIQTATSTARNPGTTLAGSSLRYSNAGGISGSAPGGTWRLMGYINSSGDGNNNTSLWQRIG